MRGSAVPTAHSVRRQPLGAVDLRWNRFGTPSSILLPPTASRPGHLHRPGPGGPRALRAHAAVFGLTSPRSTASGRQRPAVRAGDAHAVLFRQRFGDLAPALDSMVTVGVARGRDRLRLLLDHPAPHPPVRRRRRSPGPGSFVRAATDVGRDLDAGVVGDITSSVAEGWTRLSVPASPSPPAGRLRSLAMADGSVRPVFETDVLDVAKGSAFAYTVMVDGVTGAVLHRQNQAENNNDVYPFQGEVTASECGPEARVRLTDANTRQIVAVAAMANTLDDVTVKIFAPGATCWWRATWRPARGGDVHRRTASRRASDAMQVCPFADPTTPFLPPGNYVASVTSSDTTGPSAGDVGPEPTWRYFTATRPWTTPRHHAEELGGRLLDADRRLQHAERPVPQRRRRGSVGRPARDRALDDDDRGQQREHPRGLGRPAGTRRHRAGPGLPDAGSTRPPSPTPGTTRVRPDQLRPGGNDIDATVTNLFVAHNRCTTSPTTSASPRTTTTCS